MNEAETLGKLTYLIAQGLNSFDEEGVAVPPDDVMARYSRDPIFHARCVRMAAAIFNGFTIEAKDPHQIEFVKLVEMQRYHHLQQTIACIKERANAVTGGRYHPTIMGYTDDLIKTLEEDNA